MFDTCDIQNTSSSELFVAESLSIRHVKKCVGTNLLFEISSLYISVHEKNVIRLSLKKTVLKASESSLMSDQNCLS